MQLTRAYFRSLTDSALWDQTESLATQERRIAVEFLHHLREIESRMLHLARGYSSLQEFLTQHLHYSGASAYRRVQAMRALKVLPDLEDSLIQGTLTLTAATQVQVFLNQAQSLKKPYSLDEKRDLFEKVKGLSTRATEKLLVSLAPETAVPRDQVRQIAPGQTLVSFVADDELMQMLERIKELDSHQNPSPTYLKLFKRLAMISLQKLDPEKKPVSALKKFDAKKSENPAQNRHIPVQLQRSVWLRDQGRCQYQDPLTGRKCESRYLAQFEHKILYARGGRHTLENLEVLCANHNRLRAVQELGRASMGRFLRFLSADSPRSTPGPSSKT